MRAEWIALRDFRRGDEVFRRGELVPKAGRWPETSRLRRSGVVGFYDAGELQAAVEAAGDKADLRELRLALAEAGRPKQLAAAPLRGFARVLLPSEPLPRLRTGRGASRARKGRRGPPERAREAA